MDLLVMLISVKMTGAELQRKGAARKQIKQGLNRSRRPTPWTESFGCMDSGGANARRPVKGEGFAREPAKPP